MRIIFEGGEVLDLKNINKVIIDTDEEEVMLNKSIIFRHYEEMNYPNGKGSIKGGFFEVKERL